LVLFIIIITLIVSDCSSTPPQNTTALNNHQENKSHDMKVYLSKIEYYFDYIGKPVPSHFKPVNRGSNIYMPPENNPTIGREILSVGVKNGKVDMVFVFCIFENRSEYGDWFWNYLTEAEKLGFRHLIDNENDKIFFIKEDYTFVFIDKEEEHDTLFGGQFEFWRSQAN